MADKKNIKKIKPDFSKVINFYEYAVDKMTEIRHNKKIGEHMKADSATETNEILQEIEDHLWYDMPNDEKETMKQQRAYSGEVIYLLTKILVEKGLLSSEEVRKHLRK